MKLGISRVDIADEAVGREAGGREAAVSVVELK